MIGKNDLFELYPDVKTVAWLKLILTELSVPFVENALGEPVVFGDSVKYLLPCNDYKSVTKVTVIGRNQPGVYLLRNGAEVVYVGMTKSILSRMEKHARSKMVWDSATFYHVDYAVAHLLEEELIAQYDPKYNVSKSPSRNANIASRSASV